MLTFPSPDRHPEQQYAEPARDWAVRTPLSAPIAIDANSRELLRGIADQACQAIVNARTYAQAVQRLEQLQALRAIDLAITTGQELSRVLATGVEQVARQLAVDAVAVRRYEPSNGWLHWGVGVGFRDATLALAPVAVGGSFAGEVIAQRRRLSHDELAGLAVDRTFAAALRHEGFVAYYGVPLVANDQVLGVLEVSHRSPLRPDAEWLAFLDTLAGQIAIAVAHAALFTGLHDANLALMRALDLRDKETEGHIADGALMR